MNQLPEFNNFKVLTLIMPGEVKHCIYFRMHSNRHQSDHLPKGKTLFVINLPVDINVSTLKNIFTSCGRIKNVIFKGKKSELGFSPKNFPHASGTVAHLIFKEDDAIEKCYQMDDHIEYKSEAVVGINKWIGEYLNMIPDSTALKESIDQELLEFEELERKSKLEALEARNVPDKDGFVTVTRRGRRNTNIDGTGAVISAIDPKELKNLKPKDNSLVDFYRFQMRESKKNALQELRKKFEEDKIKIQKLKEKRKFKPY